MLDKARPVLWSFLRNASLRSVFTQALLLLGIILFLSEILRNAVHNLEDLRLGFGFHFLFSSANFAISQSLIAYSEHSSFFKALLVGLVNTVVISFLGILFATFLGFSIGLMRLSKNWLISRTALCYVELLRNIPLLLQIFIWYQLIVSTLPIPRDAFKLSVISPPFELLAIFFWLFVVGYAFKFYYKKISTPILRIFFCLAFAFPFLWFALILHTEMPLSFLKTVEFGVFAHNRGILFPKPLMEPPFLSLFFSFIFSALAIFFLSRWSSKRQAETGETFPVLFSSLLLLIVVPYIAYTLFGAPLSFEYPEFRGFNFRGGISILPEFVALFLALSTYTASFISEVVRSGVQAVGHGQTEAASALGIKRSVLLRKIIVPQAMRVIIPPLASQYLNLTKNSSLAAAIGYPDLVAVGGVVLSQTGHAIEIVMIWMIVYLTLSLSTSFLMNVFNAKMKLVER